MAKKPEIKKNKIVVFTGAGVSVESGLSTFKNGLWEEHNINEVATAQALHKNPEFVLGFYDQRLQEMSAAKPNAAHIAIAELEKEFEVVVITQNCDSLHEAAGSSNVLHLHGRMDHALPFDDITAQPIDFSGKSFLDKVDGEFKWRPQVVLYGEIPHHLTEAKKHILEASKIMIVGTSLSVAPACNLVKHARGRAEKVLVAFDVHKKPYGFKWYGDKATTVVPRVVKRWIENKE